MYKFYDLFRHLHNVDLPRESGLDAAVGVQALNTGWRKDTGILKDVCFQ